MLVVFLHFLHFYFILVFIFDLLVLILLRLLGPFGPYQVSMQCSYVGSVISFGKDWKKMSLVRHVSKIIWDMGEGEVVF